MISLFLFLFFCVLAAIYITGRTVVYPGGGRLVGESSGLCLLRNILIQLAILLCSALICSVFVALSILSLSLSLQRRRTSLPGTDQLCSQ